MAVGRSRRRSVISWLAFIVLILGASGLVRAATIRPLDPVPFNSGQFLVFAHRGASGVLPEETMEAFRKAVEMGADVLELDVHLTKDGKVVVFHDETLERTTNGKGLVRDHTYEDLLQLDAGYKFSTDGDKTFPYRGKGFRVPLLSEVLEAFPSTRVSVEIKSTDPGVEVAVFDTLERRHARDRVVVASFDGDTLRRFRRIAPEYATSSAEDETRKLVILHKLGLGRLMKPFANAYQVPEKDSGITIVTPGFLRLARRQGAEVYVWTVNDAPTMKRLVEAGVDGIITDYPDVLVAVLKEMGRR